jgi:putative phosphoesterase
MLDVIDKTLQDGGCVIHLGDHASDADLVLKKHPGINLTKVRGNCDYAPQIPAEAIITAEGHKIFLTHGHLQNVKTGYNHLITSAISREADICLFGHTHTPDIFYYENILFLNPGSISLSRSILCPTYAVINFANGKAEASVVAKEAFGYRPVFIKPKVYGSDFSEKGV